jgi:hypothetical protein
MIYERRRRREGEGGDYDGRDARSSTHSSADDMAADHDAESGRPSHSYATLIAQAILGMFPYYPS